MERFRPEGWSRDRKRAGAIVVAVALAGCGSDGPATNSGDAPAVPSLPQDPCQILTIEGVETATGSTVVRAGLVQDERLIRPQGGEGFDLPPILTANPRAYVTADLTVYPAAIGTLAGGGFAIVPISHREPGEERAVACWSTVSVPTADREVAADRDVAPSVFLRSRILTKNASLCSPENIPLHISEPLGTHRFVPAKRRRAFRPKRDRTQDGDGTAFPGRFLDPCSRAVPPKA